jgi:uncharacterized protein
VKSAFVILSEDLARAADEGDPFAQFERAISLENGNDGEQDFAQAAVWYAKSSAQGHASAEMNLLLMHVFGQADVLAPDAVIERLLALADAGDLECQNNLGLCYQFGFSAPQDYEKAVHWFARAALGGSATAQFNLGGMYYEGKGVEKDLDLALKCYKRSAEQRHELALLQLGSMYQKGIGVETNLGRARVLYSIAYRQGSSRAANHLGLLFKKGLGVERDDSIAYQLYLESIERPDTPEIADNPSYRASAFFWLGYMTEHGEGTEMDLRQARKWYKQGAACGQQSCVTALARLRSRSNRPQCRGASREATE